MLEIDCSKIMIVKKIFDSFWQPIINKYMKTSLDSFLIVIYSLH